MTTIVRVDTEAYPFSNFGKKFKIQHVDVPKDKCCIYMLPCICIYENFSVCLLFIGIFLWPFLPFCVLISMCYFRFKPKIQMTSLGITKCPDCKRGYLKYSTFIDGGLSCCPNEEYVFICEKCFKIYQDELPSEYTTVDRELERSG